MAGLDCTRVSNVTIWKCYRVEQWLEQRWDLWARAYWKHLNRHADFRHEYGLGVTNVASHTRNVKIPVSTCPPAKGNANSLPPLSIKVMYPLCI